MVPRPDIDAIEANRDIIGTWIYAREYGGDSMFDGGFLESVEAGRDIRAEDGGEFPLPLVSGIYPPQPPDVQTNMLIYADDSNVFFNFYPRIIFIIKQFFRNIIIYHFYK